MYNADWEGGEAIEALIEVVDEGCTKIDVVSFDVPSGELMGLHGHFCVIDAFFGNQCQ